MYSSTAIHRTPSHLLVLGKSRLNARPRQEKRVLYCRCESSEGKQGEGAHKQQQRVCTRRNAGTMILGVPAVLYQMMGDAGSAAKAEGENERVYFDITVDGKPKGRIVVQMLEEASRIGKQRFLDLAKGVEGVGYRRSKINLIQDDHIAGGGLKSLSYKASGKTKVAGGPTAELLEDELAASMLKHDQQGLVSIAVKPRKALESKDKLVALDGQFVNVTEVMGESPNGTEFAITCGASPSLDSTNLIIGKVVEGFDVVQEISKLPRVKDNTNSPFFKAGKAAGDKRANVAEKGFNRPFSKILIQQSGIL